MCTYLTEKIDIQGSGRGREGYFSLTEAMVYVDHPQHAPFAHTVNIDFRNPELGAGARIPVELTEEAARALIAALQESIASAPPGLASAHAPATH